MICNYDNNPASEGDGRASSDPSPNSKANSKVQEKERSSQWLWSKLTSKSLRSWVLTDKDEDTITIFAEASKQQYLMAYI